ncbi:MAG: hypothetical protein FJX72_17440 [Armatimonadetes bacterium]|nr:hypothetical protein [Armatimonadota bacterium]
MWMAFGVMFGVDMLNGLAFFYPALPRINVRFLGDVAKWFPNRPWSDIGWTPIGVFPYLSAIGLFMPTDLLFSCVFFFFFRKAQQVLLSSMGYEQGYFGGGGLLPSPPYSSAPVGRIHRARGDGNVGEPGLPARRLVRDRERAP